jgi:hypothetical protein
MLIFLLFVTPKKHDIELMTYEYTTLYKNNWMLKIFAFSDTNEADHILTTTGNYRIHHSVQEQLQVKFFAFCDTKEA